MIEKLDTYLDPLADTGYELAGQNGVLCQDRYCHFRLAQALDEALKSRFGRIASQVTL